MKLQNLPVPNGFVEFAPKWRRPEFVREFVTDKICFEVTQKKNHKDNTDVIEVLAYKQYSYKKYRYGKRVFKMEEMDKIVSYIENFRVSESIFRVRFMRKEKDGAKYLAYFATLTCVRGDMPYRLTLMRKNFRSDSGWIPCKYTHMGHDVSLEKILEWVNSKFVELNINPEQYEAETQGKLSGHKNEEGDKSIPSGSESILPLAG